MQSNIAAWNIRGAHKPMKQDQIKNLIHDHNLSLLSISETKLNPLLSSKASSYINPSWFFVTNHDPAPYGRLMVIYDPSVFILTPIIIHRQFIHAKVHHIPSKMSLYMTFVYASNISNERQSLLDYLPHFRQNTHPWLVIGDFNCCYKSDHKHGGIPLTVADFSPLHNAMLNAELIEVPSIGSEFTWSNKSLDGPRTLTKIDHALMNLVTLNLWPTIKVNITMPLLSDHCPLILSVGSASIKKQVNFKFFDVWTTNSTFMQVVREAWSIHTYGNPMLNLQRKLKNTKEALKSGLQRYTEMETKSRTLLQMT